MSFKETFLTNGAAAWVVQQQTKGHGRPGRGQAHAVTCECNGVVEEVALSPEGGGVG